MPSDRPAPFFWSLRDVGALVVASLVLGVVFFLWEWVVRLLSGILPSVALGLLYGVWYWGGLLLAYAIRKPGAALLGEFGAALVEFGLGSPMGMLVLVLGWVQGLGAEVTFAWARFNRWGLMVMLLAGALAGASDVAVNLVVQLAGANAVEAFKASNEAVRLVAPPLQLAQRSGGTIAAMFITTLVSGAILGGLVCKLLGDRLLAIPAARNFLGTPTA